MQRILSMICLSLLITGPVAGQDNPVYGPENGTLLAIGGGVTSNDLILLMKDQMGGWDKPLVIVPTAAPDQDIDINTTRQQWLNYGFTDVTVLHTTDTAVANTDTFVAPLQVAKGVWSGGGRQWRLVDAYYNTNTLDEFRGVLDRGGIIAGSSAGASIQASFLARGGVAGNVPIISPEPEHQVGFGFLKNSAIDQHIDTRNRWDEMAEIVIVHPEILGIGLCESTAIFVQGDCIEVLGNAQVAITDSARLNSCVDTCYELLVASNSFNIQTRQKGGCIYFPTSAETVELTADTSINVYPNPTSGDFGIIAQGSRMEAIRIFNLMGVQVKEIISAPTAQIWINTAALSNGTYLLQINSDMGTEFRKFILNRR